MKTKKTILKYVLVLGMGLVVSMSCSKDSTEPTPESPISETPGTPENPSGLSFAAVVAKGGTFEDVPQSRMEDVIAEGEDFTEDYREGEGSDAETKRFVCTSRTVSVSDGTGDFQTLGGAASEIYPGALLQGKTINNVKPKAIPLKRAGGSISYSLNDGNLQASQDLVEMSESQVRQAMNNIISGSSGVVPYNFDLSYENVFSEQQLALNMALSYEGYGVKAEGKLSFSSDKTYNRILVKLNQQYYDVSYDFPTGFDDIFDESVTPEDLDSYIQPDNPATYIKKVTYGRIFYMLIESTSSLQVMNAEVSASYNGFKNKVEGELEVDTMKKMENLKVKVIAYGGDAQNTFSALGETNVEALADMLSQSTDIRTGLPLSYEIYSLEDPSKQVGTNISTEMEVVECELKGVLPPPAYANLVDLFEDGVGAATQIHERYAAIFNGAGTQYVIYNAVQGSISAPYGIKDANAPLGATTLNSVGAALLQFIGQIYLFNGVGLEYEILVFDPSTINAMPTEPLGAFVQENGTNRRWFVDENFSGGIGPSSGYVAVESIQCESSYPLVNQGIKAAVRNDILVNTPVGHRTVSGFPRFVYADRTSSFYYSYQNNGSSYSLRQYYRMRNDPAFYGGATFSDFNCWGPEIAVTGVRENVEAAFKVDYSNGNVQLQISFTSNGLMAIYNMLEREEEGPYAL